MSSNAVIIGPLTGSSIEVPFYSSRVPAGFPSPAQDHLEQTLSLDELLGVHAAHTYLVRADGDSMTGAGIFSGDILVVSRGLTAVCGDIVIAGLNGETFVKRLGKHGLATVLLSENPQFSPRYIMEGDELVTWGVVIANVRRHATHG